MIVYHGSNLEIRNPDCFHSRKTVDFGPGFYVTPILEQARNWAAKFKRRSEPAVVSRYALNDQVLTSSRALHFDTYSEEWLDFIIACRAGNVPADYDVIMGGVANDRVFDTMNLYLEALISKRDALERLKYYKPNYQICLKRQSLIDLI